VKLMAGQNRRRPRGACCELRGSLQAHGASCELRS
jgi:hypothetical protein